MKEVRDAIASILDNTSLADVVGKINTVSVRQLEALMYHI
jgi:hypothetical protein